MSSYYTVPRTRNLFDPASKEPYKLSRSRLENFLRCERCFYLDRRLGVDTPPGFPFNLNSAVDTLLKKEFDAHRANSTRHPLCAAYNLDLIPFAHPSLNVWRENFQGVQYHHQPTNLIITGAVDDLWQNEEGMIYVVDYKSTSKDSDVTIDAQWQDGYKRQLEIYQWLLRRNNLSVSNTGYFVYCNGKTDRAAFDGKLEFDIKILPYSGNDSWVEKAIICAHKCLTRKTIPAANKNCDYCCYREAAKKAEKQPHGRAR
ncbi:MAG: PD-(D/E)XK nuclease family protein [Candidatus Buchananbacteria bacterium]|nr:PD-(D/E)XK nuclease family protein [Candidatus Buchananbacteria bacterium]